MKINGKLKLLSLFSGIGAFESALDRMNIEYELVNFCEIDKYASKSYCAVHRERESKNLGDITKVDTSLLPQDIDLITYGFPCQDISLAGQQKGFVDENGDSTRSGLFFEALRIIEDTKPKIAIAENVKNLVSKKFKAEFQFVLDSLEQAGYNNYWQVLNSKNYGIPQNRERVFIVSIRKDLDDGTFRFGEPFELKLRLKDMLEEEVDEKYYLSDKMISWLKGHTERSVVLNRGFQWKPKTELDIGNSVTAHNGFAVTDNTITIPEKTKKGYAEASDGDGVYLNRPYQKRGVVQKNSIQTIKTNCNDVGVVVKGKSYLRNFGSRGKLEDTNDVSSTLVSAMGTGGGNVPLVSEIINVGNTKSGGERSTIISSKGICKSLTATDYKQPVQIMDEDERNKC